MKEAAKQQVRVRGLADMGNGYRVGYAYNGHFMGLCSGLVIEEE